MKTIMKKPKTMFNISLGKTTWIFNTMHYNNNCISSMSLNGTTNQSQNIKMTSGHVTIVKLCDNRQTEPEKI
jgi:hypothetical protein